MMDDDAFPNDHFGAFIPPRRWCRSRGQRRGPLAGLAFAVKDAIDLAGYRTGAGNPDWLRTHPPATSNAWACKSCDAGASVVGKTITDELTFSLNGENIHYGTPVIQARRAASRVDRRAVRPRPWPAGWWISLWGPIAAAPSAPGELLRHLRHAAIARPDLDRRSVPARTEFRHCWLVQLATRSCSKLSADITERRTVPSRPRRLLVAADAFTFCGSQIETRFRTRWHARGCCWASPNR